jgi:hypothetical protein
VGAAVLHLHVDCSMSENRFRRKAPAIMARLIADFPQLEPEDAAAILGNIGGETGGFRLLQEQRPLVKGSRGGYGWCQWTGPRRRAFEAWCQRHDLDPASDEANYGYLCLELRGPEKRALDALRAASTLADKTIAFERAFERAGIPHHDARIRWAEIAIAEYLAWHPPVPDVPSPRSPKSANEPPTPAPRDHDAAPPPRQPDDPGPEPQSDAARTLPWWHPRRLWLWITSGGAGLGGLAWITDPLAWAKAAAVLTAVAVITGAVVFVAALLLFGRQRVAEYIATRVRRRR